MEFFIQLVAACLLSISVSMNHTLSFAFLEIASINASVCACFLFSWLLLDFKQMIIYNSKWCGNGYQAFDTGLENDMLLILDIDGGKGAYKR